ncbi:alpha/beta fold hydrolase [Cellulomonas aerilata]|uniref:Alpha/beta hydrolase n=1 Tax=Cellulomonas aerilata TaxID=515326 RepID=A0A512DBC6_9CELL|nr:alpha/beta fold hydrolase [Cellulomonas aerilata]GEO33540.1 alpha/beta hydrolase [Cellulomonas aerilata]
MVEAGPAGEPIAVSSSGPDGAQTLLLLHGVGTTGWMWRRLVADLSSDLHVLVVDLPGHGASAARPWRSLADTVDAVAGVIHSSARDGRAHLVGLSLGGYVALELAARRPELALSATVSGVNVLPFPRPRLMRLAGRLMSPFMTAGPLLRANARALAVHASDYAGYAAAARSMAPGTFLAVGEDLLTYTVPAVAATSTTRVLAMAGSQEQVLIRRSLPVVATAFPQGEARIAPGVGHAWNGQSPELFAAAVRATVNGAAPPPALLKPEADG